MISVNSVLEPLYDHAPIAETMVVAFICSSKDRLYGVSESTKSRKPDPYSLSAVRTWIDQGLVRCRPFLVDEWRLRPDSQHSPAARRIRDKRMAIIEPIVTDQLEDFLLGTYGAKIVESRRLEVGCGRASIYRYLNEYFRGGQTKNALLPNYQDVGRQAPNEESAKVGARPKYGVPLGSNATERDKKNFEFLFQKFIKTNTKSIKATYDEELVEKIYVEDRRVSPTGPVERVPVPVGERPTLVQFRYYVKKRFEELGLKRQYLGISRTNIAKDYKGRSGDAPRPVGPGDVYQLDATPMDADLVSRFCPERKGIVGRATIYTVIDTYSGAYVGVYTCIGPPSWEAARVALFMALRRKDSKYFEELGMKPPTDQEWCMDGAPRVLLVDNAEIASKLAETIPRDVGTKVVYARVRRGDDKGLVEYRLKLINEWLRNLPGYRRKDKNTGQRIDGKRDAVLTLQMVTAHIVRRAINANNREEVDYSYLSPEMAQVGVEPYPTDIWEWGVRYRPSHRRILDDRELYLSLLEKGEATARPDGIYFKGCKYRCAEVRQLGLQDKLPTGHKSPVLEIRFMRHSARFILICLPGGQTAVALLTKKSDRFEKLSFDEVEIQLEEERSATARRENARRQAVANVNAETEAMVKAAQREQAPMSAQERKRRSTDQQYRDLERGAEIAAERERYERYVEAEFHESVKTAPAEDCAHTDQQTQPDRTAVSTPSGFYQTMSEILEEPDEDDSH
ncbi:DDE-type integrase/transposase/recombinase [Ectothiorhodospiraceae bacterium WFHF3C12]|nr:DDE-type integrase/transposase/recombinase [Ectothiorhodospiraceae bacterium WFHF3C12]